MPESFRVLVKELQSLGLAVEVINEEERAAPVEGSGGVFKPEPEGEIGEGQALIEVTEDKATPIEESGEVSKPEPEGEISEDQTLGEVREENV